MIDQLFAIIEDRKLNSPGGSYTVDLMASGEDRILQKVGEEAMELILATKGQGDQRVIEETADLFYHCLVLLSYKGISIERIYLELQARHKQE